MAKKPTKPTKPADAIAQIEALTFNTKARKIVVMLNDGDVREYNGRDAYLADWPDRAADCAAMGW